MTALLARMRGAIASVVGGIVGTLVGPTTITTSTVATATAYSNQRKVDRCQNGVLWMIYNHADNSAANNWSAKLAYSTDDGATWTSPAAADGGVIVNGSGNSGTSYVPNPSLFIDLDDYAHVVYKDRYDGWVYYRRGTPNASRTAWTWSAAVAVDSVSAYDYPDVVAHREGTEWKAHLVMSYVSGTFNAAYHKTFTISSAGAISAGPNNQIGGSYGVAVHTWPSIDFNHTGDGKTVAGSTPHLYAAWSAGATGAGKGIRFKKATYSAGSWTWGTEREIDSTRYWRYSTDWMTCLFDGTRVVIVGRLPDPTTSDLVVYERDAADTTTTTRLLLVDGTVAEQVVSGSASYDGDGNLYLIGRYADPGDMLGYRKWTRSTATLGSMVQVDAAANASPYVSAKRGYSNGRIELVYTDGTASPYNVNYGAIT